MRFRFAVCLVPFLAALAFASCSNETEGQPCDTRAGNSGDDDCASGLVCTVVSAQGARCCPSDRTTAKTSECALSSTTSDASNPAPPAEASTPEASSPDAPAETASEAAAETGTAADASDGSTTE